ncbi:MAG: hypothetical protein P9X22_04940 [Candidatus Zapsychrus exili]|nr:hypothetical protein [Candidatus Zapsychrus exili]
MIDKVIKKLDFKVNGEFIDKFALFFIGAISLLYILFSSQFAEWNIKFSFLSFPIFIGEVVLFICLILFFLKGGVKLKFSNKTQIAILCYLVFVVLKALIGYHFWGPLAFRHAALFYYPLFIVLGYSFYRKDFFSKRNIFVFFCILLCIILFKNDSYWLLTCCALVFILIGSIRIKLIRYAAFAGFIAVIPYASFVNMARMMILGNLAAMIFLGVALSCFVKLSKKKKVLLFISFVIFVSFFFVKLVERNISIKSIFSFDQMTQTFLNYEDIIKKSIDSYEVKHIDKVGLYNPDLSSLQVKINGQIGKERKEKDIKLHYERLKRKVIEEKDRELEIKQAELESAIQGKEEFVLKEKEGRMAEQDMLAVLEVKNQTINMENKIVDLIKNNDESVSQYVLDDSIVSTSELSEGQKSEGTNSTIGFDTHKEKDAFVKDIYREDSFIENYTKKIEEINVEKERQVAAISKMSEEAVEDIYTIGIDEQQIGYRDFDNACVNAVFRIFIWRDMFVELFKEKPLLGFSFGKPLRSISLEMLEWGKSEWSREGWVAAHNSYFNMIYRAGLVGLIFILSILTILFKMVKFFIINRSFVGILLCAIIINWFVAANFLLIFELPYTAIPIWTIYGMTFAYYSKLKRL